MELISQKMRRLAPELDPLRLGTGWKPEELSKPQIIVESTFGDSTREADIWTNWSKLPAREFRMRAGMVPGITAPISVMVKVREPMASISALQAVR